MRVIAIACIGLALASCAHSPTPEPIIRTVEVKVPTPVPCVATEVPTTPYPDTADALLAAPNIFDAVMLLMEARKLRPANEAILRAARCKGAP